MPVSNTQSKAKQMKKPPSTFESLEKNCELTYSPSTESKRSKRAHLVNPEKNRNRLKRISMPQNTSIDTESETTSVNNSSKGALLFTPDGKHIIDESLSQGGQVWGEMKSLVSNGFKPLAKLVDDISTGKNQSPLKDILFIAGGALAGLFTVHSAVQGVKGFSPNSPISGARNLAKTILGFQILKNCYQGATHKSFNTEGEGRKEMGRIGTRLGLITLIWLYENNKFSSKVNDDLNYVGQKAVAPLAKLTKRIFTGL